MMNRVKAARHRLENKQGSVIIEAALYFIVAAALLTGILHFGKELIEYYQINSLTDHVGQIVARADTISSSSIQAVLDDTQASEATALNGATLCVTVTSNGTAVLSVPAACSCTVVQNSDISSLQSAATKTLVVLVNGCIDNYSSSSAFVSGATLGQ